MSKSILLAGGYGVVGAQIAQLLSRRHPEIHLMIAGRSSRRAQELANALPHATGLALDMADADPLLTLATQPDLVVAVANDVEDHLLLACLRRGIAYLDITRWTERLRRTLLRLPAQPAASAPVAFASSWMASVPAVLARGLSRDMAVDTIDIDILYALQDKAGPNSAEYLDRLATPFEVMEAGCVTQKKPFTEPHLARFTDGGTVRVYRFDAPDQVTLPAITGAAAVSTRIAFDSRVATGLLALLVRSGIWRAISGRRFTRLRRGLLYNPGNGAHHRVVVHATGRDTAGNRIRRMLEIDAPEGQTHLTAVGALIQIERILGLKGHIAAPATPHYAEALTDSTLAQRTLQDFGIRLDFVTN